MSRGFAILSVAAWRNWPVIVHFLSGPLYKMSDPHFEEGSAPVTDSTLQGQGPGVPRLCLFKRPTVILRFTSPSCASSLAGDPGFEPGLTDPESVVLPLD